MCNIDIPVAEIKPNPAASPSSPSIQLNAFIIPVSQITVINKLNKGYEKSIFKFSKFKTVKSAISIFETYFQNRQETIISIVNRDHGDNLLMSSVNPTRNIMIEQAKKVKICKSIPNNKYDLRINNKEVII